jgi:hypothetical protein
VDTFGLFERSPEEEERDERLALLMELRKFRQQHPEQFRRIQNLPLRARVGRADATRAGSTVTFIRSHRRDGFYRLTSGAGVPPAASGGVPAAEAATSLEEITVLEAAREFRAPDLKEKTIPLHAAHHDHVNAALARFKEQSTAQALQAEVADAAQGPNERRALAYLDGFLSLPFVSDEETRLIKAARQAIRRARFLKLQRQINQLQRSTKEVKIAPAALADKLMQILRGYPLLDQADQPITAVHPRFLDTPPDIILSESFDHPPTK